MNRSESIVEIAKALTAAQLEMKGPKKDAVNPAFKRPYATLSAFTEAVVPVAAKHGIATVQDATNVENGVAVSVFLLHTSGEWLGFGPLFVPVGKNDAQGFGTAITYGRRYLLAAVFSIAADEDDDGNKISGKTADPATASGPRPLPPPAVRPVTALPPADASLVAAAEKIFASPVPPLPSNNENDLTTYGVPQSVIDKGNGNFDIKIDGKFYGTKDESVAAVARTAGEKNKEIEITYWEKKGNKPNVVFRNISGISTADDTVLI